ncbi:unnamed protein product, partial [marine sediment metagenome]
DLAPVQRRRILEHWFAQRGIAVAEELLTRTGMHPKETEKLLKEDEKKKRVAEGNLWTVDVSDTGIPRVRMIKDAAEPGTTLAEATSAAKEIGKDYAGGEALVTFNESLGRHMPNFKSDFVKQHPGAAWAVAKQMDQAMAEGTPIDPMDTFIDQMTKVESMKELVGAGAKVPQPTGTLTDIVSAVKEIRTMAGGEGKLPEWLSDPVAFQKTIQSLVPSGDSEVLKELRDEMAKVREDLHQSELKHKDEQIATLSSDMQGYRNEVSSLRAEMERNKAATGKTAY